MLSQSDIEKMTEHLGMVSVSLLTRKVKHFDKLSDEIIHKTMSQNYLNASNKYTPAFEEQTHGILCKGNQHLPKCAK